MKNKPTIDSKFSLEEERLEQELLNGEYVSEATDESKQMWSEAIANHRELSQTKQMTIRVDAGDLIKVKAKAKENSMPYQTLLKILFKQFAEGKVAIKV
jgi:predicted DNA binding CopG/RHH family protein